jgi:nucleotide-binding universal stress UspA family protein
MFNKIIVGYDGSEGSRAAFARAVEMMQYKPDTKLLVAYVNEDVLNGDTAYSGEPLVANSLTAKVTSANPDLSSPRQLARDYENQMTDSIQTHLDRSQIKGQIVAIDGQPAQSLADLAEKEQADAIFVGNSGKSGFQKFFVGSVSEKLVKNSPCTVIVVK